MTQRSAGRILVLRSEGPLDGSGLTPEQVATGARACGARFLLLDATNAPYADSSGLRWLLRLQSEMERAGKRLRIVARRGGRVWRNLSLLNAGMDVYPSAGRAWRSPWRARPAAAEPDHAAPRVVA